jgi:superfamily II DNA or RNA helicase
MKAVLSNRIYLNADTELQNELKQELLYTIDRMPASEFPEIIQNCITITPNTCSIPCGREDLIPEDYTVIDKRVEPKVHIPNPSFTLRGAQADAAAQISSGIVKAKPGFGKTIVGLAIAHKLQTKTLIICTTTAIRDMWMSEIKKWLGIEAGIIGSGKFNVEPPIVVANIQTLRNKYKEVQSLFGLVIVDEVHRSVAATFNLVLNNMKCKHRVGLSGTLERKDGKHVVIKDYFGSNVFVAPVENTIDPSVHVYKHPFKLNMNEFIPWSTLVTRLMEDPTYNTMVRDLALKYANLGHKVLVISSRTGILEWGHKETEDRSLIITGDVKGVELREEILDHVRNTKEVDILWGSQTIFSEGVSVNELSVVILATPINNDPLLEQIAGRIMRKAEGKLTPVLVDINLAGNTGKNHANMRKRFYVNAGWSVTFPTN